MVTFIFTTQKIDIISNNLRRYTTVELNREIKRLIVNADVLIVDYF